MNVAVLTGGDVLRYTFKDSFRRLTGFKIVATGFVAIDDFNPLNIMFFFHRVRITADLDLDSVAGALDHGDMLFLSLIGGTLIEQYHVFAAADKFSIATFEYLDNVSASFTFINLFSFGHAYISC